MTTTRRARQRFGPARHRTATALRLLRPGPIVSTSWPKIRRDPKSGIQVRRHLMSSRTAPVFIAPGLAAVLLLLQGGAGAAAGPFTGMAGDWSGGGKLTLASGSSERLRCRANNSVGPDGDTIDLNIRCASDSYKIDLSGHVRNTNGSLSGQWSEPNYNSAGTLSGQASGNSINALAIGNTLSARLSMKGSGKHMSVTIEPQGTDVRQVSLSFQKR
jgi:hypothetical protein